MFLKIFRERPQGVFASLLHIDSRIDISRLAL